MDFRVIQHPFYYFGFLVMTGSRNIVKQMEPIETKASCEKLLDRCSIFPSYLPKAHLVLQVKRGLSQPHENQDSFVLPQNPHLGQVRGPADPLGHLLSIGVNLGHMLPHPFPSGLVHWQPTPVDKEGDSSISKVLFPFFLRLIVPGGHSGTPFTAFQTPWQPRRGRSCGGATPGHLLPSWHPQSL